MQQEVQADLERFSNDGQWYSDHYDELLERYPDHWIAIYHQEVVAASTEAEEMFVELKRKGMKATRAFIKFISTEDQTWIFQSAV